MPEQSDRLNFYTELYSIKNLEELEELKAEMIDRFGPVPSLVNRLLSMAELRYHSSFALFERIIIQSNNITIILPGGEKEDYYQFKFTGIMRFILENYKDKIRFEQKQNLMRLIIRNDFESPESLLKFLLEFSLKISDIMKSESNVSTT
jgi:transcription-repair coupling factor (superfamily II helicase)